MGGGGWNGSPSRQTCFHGCRCRPRHIYFTSPPPSRPRPYALSRKTRGPGQRRAARAVRGADRGFTSPPTPRPREGRGLWRSPGVHSRPALCPVPRPRAPDPTPPPLACRGKGGACSLSLPQPGRRGGDERGPEPGRPSIALRALTNVPGVLGQPQGPGWPKLNRPEAVCSVLTPRVRHSLPTDGEVREWVPHAPPVPGGWTEPFAGGHALGQLHPGRDLSHQRCRRTGPAPEPPDFSRHSGTGQVPAGAL